jgi:uncharacterized protein (TIGR01777 family)
MKALVTGGTGFIGRRLLARLDRPVVLSRDPDRARQSLSPANATVHGWDAHSPPSAAAFADVDTFIHLAGDPVADRRWDEAKRREIRDSRVLGTRFLVDGLAALSTRPRVLVCASAVGYYGDRGDETLDENSAPGSDFLAQVCVDWEREAMRAESLGMRVARVRIGVVLGRGGGALAKMLTPFRLGLGGRLASGRQWMPWVHLDDVVGLLLHAAANESVAGPINATAPTPATNAEFTQALAGALHRPAIFPMPGFMLKLVMGEFGEIVLASQKVIPAVAQRTGYSFQHPQIGPALAAIVAEAS